MARIVNLASSVNTGEKPTERKRAHRMHIIIGVAVLLGVSCFIISLLLGYYWFRIVLFLFVVIVAIVPASLSATITGSLDIFF
ncbi:unnamed protein product [Didymodactylos carnosus]|uniref:Uncharacterized protein n=1 Tax=Didymodactylos carnosus TaxID=1234261 RepID=A0A816F7V6_9BILA|nr:unnamed protein product [Didymodactylos carnosus]CAF4603821.1 unnamed protein product [Didymodactylos carnosus]